MVLTPVLARAVPEVRVESVVLTKTLTGHYWIRVVPEHYEYWERFKRKYPHCERLARARSVEEWSLTYRSCPEFHSKEDLLGWLVDTLDLTRGERKLLKILFGYKC